VTGGRAYLENVRIDNCVGDAVRADLGQGFVQLINVGGSGNGGVGVFVNDGAEVKANIVSPPFPPLGLPAPIPTNTVGGLVGAGGEFKVGSLAAVGAGLGWTGAPLGPYDLSATPPAITDTGSRLYSP
jgi:hypothetical protein